MNILELARQAGFLLRNGREDFWMATTDSIERFAALVRAEERARLIAEIYLIGNENKFVMYEEIAAAIRGMKDE